MSLFFSLPVAVFISPVVWGFILVIDDIKLTSYTFWAVYVRRGRRGAIRPQGWTRRDDKGLKVKEYMELVTRSRGSSVASIPPRDVVHLTPNGGADGARRPHALYNQTFIHTFLQDGGR